MPQEIRVGNRQRRKRKALVAILASVFIVAILAQFRFVTALNDAVSPKPQYMKHIAEGIAQSLSIKLHNPAPIFVKADEDQDCKTVTGTHPYDSNRLYFLITYSEKSYSWCLAVYARAIASSPPEKVITLLPYTGKNYGDPMPEPAKVAPVGHFSEIYSPQILFSLLHWRAQPGKTLHTQFNDAQAGTTEVVLPTEETIRFNLLDLRPQIAKMHDWVNLILLNSLCLASLVLLVLVGRLWSSQRQFQRECLIYGQTISWWEFLLLDLTKVFAEIQDMHYRKQGASHQQSRTQAIFRRTRDEITSRLQGLLLLPLSQSQKQRIRDALDSNDLDAMKDALQEVQGLPLNNPPELRLQQLLESLKDFCEANELTLYQQQALRIFSERGFREAREFVVKIHEELRLRAKKAQHDDAQENAS